MRQPEDGPRVQLVDPLATDAHFAADSGEGLRRVVAQSVVSDHDFSQTGGQLLNEVPERGVDLVTMDQIYGIDVGGRVRLQAGGAGRTMVDGDSPPHGTGDGWDGVGAEGGAPLWVVAAEGSP